MGSEKLREAGELLREVGASIDGDTGDRLQSQGETLLDLAGRDRGPDHGRIARVQQKLRDVADDEPSVSGTVKEANDLLNQYRETVEGV